MARGRRAVVVSGAPEERGEAILDRALESAGCFATLEDLCRECGVAAAELRVTVAVDLSFLDPAVPTGVDPRLAEHLIDRLHAAGYRSVVLLGSLAEESLWYENREARVVADLVGYAFTTPGGVAYDVAGAEEDVRPGTFAQTSVLHESGVARSWADADARIVFAKNKTHPRYRYATALYTLLGVLPAPDRRHHYGERLPPAEVAAALVQSYPPDLVLVDAVVSACSGAGVEGRALGTNTVIAGDDALVVDFAAALKMGLDPFASELARIAMRRANLPGEHVLQGNLDPYAGWSNVPAVIVAAVGASRAVWEVAATADRLAAPNDGETFPERNVYVDRAHALIKEWVARGDLRDRKRLIAAAGLYVTAFVAARGVEAWRTIFAKHRIPRAVRGITVDPEAIAPDDYESLEAYFAPFERLIEASAPVADGIRLRRLDDAVLFAAERTIDVPFDAFVARVDVARSISLMNDYVGGRAIAVARDADGRATHQLERNIYLAQPNFISAVGGKQIDVTKIERIVREPDRHRIVWRTIASDNATAELDDGSVTFERDGEGTRIRIVGFQRFRLPLFFQVVRVDLIPELFDALTLDAYRRYLEGTIVNAEAAYEGDVVAAGHDSNARRGEDGADALQPAFDRIGERATELSDQVAGELRRSGLLGGVLDADGYTHVRARKRVSPKRRETTLITRLRRVLLRRLVRRGATVLGRAVTQAVAQALEPERRR